MLYKIYKYSLKGIVELWKKGGGWEAETKEGAKIHKGK